MARVYINVNAVNGGEVQTTFRALTKLTNAAATRTVRTYAKRLRSLAQQLAPRSSGKLAGSITIVGAGMRLGVRARMQYAAPVEWGRRAGAGVPGSKRLIDWLKRSGF